MNLLKTLSGTSAERVAAAAGINTFRSATVFGFKAFSGGQGTNNSGTVYLGASDTQQPVSVAPGEEVDVTLPPGAFDDWYNWYLKGASGDGIYILFY